MYRGIRIEYSHFVFYKNEISEKFSATRSTRKNVCVKPWMKYQLAFGKYNTNITEYISSAQKIPIFQAVFRTIFIIIYLYFK